MMIARRIRLSRPKSDSSVIVWLHKKMADREDSSVPNITTLKSSRNGRRNVAERCWQNMVAGILSSCVNGEGTVVLTRLRGKDATLTKPQWLRFDLCVSDVTVRKVGWRERRYTAYGGAASGPARAAWQREDVMGSTTIPKSENYGSVTAKAMLHVRRRNGS